MSLFNVKPSFLIIGAQKAATSSLYTYLIQHPNIVSPKEKELNFFNVDSNYNHGYGFYNEKFHRFLNPFKKHLTFEATPEYIYIPYVPKRIYDYNPKMKFIVILREPVERAYSAWNMFKKLHSLNKIPTVIEKSYIDNIPNNLKTILFNKDYPSFEELIKLEQKYIQDQQTFLEPSFLRRGIYHQQIQRYYQLFNANQFLFLEHREIGNSLTDTLNKVLNFVGLPTYHWNDLNRNIANKGNYEEVKPTNFQELKLFYKPHNEELFDLIQQKFDWNDK
jgi:hypothetical protein